MTHNLVSIWDLSMDCDSREVAPANVAAASTPKVALPAPVLQDTPTQHQLPWGLNWEND